MSLAVLHLYFNSIKVQLKPHTHEFSGSASIFQFHKGTIKTVIGQKDNLKLLHFNSIKVQLKRKAQRWADCRLYEFQFHKGTIKTPVSEFGHSPYSYFNSIKVQLKRNNRYHEVRFSLISIP